MQKRTILQQLISWLLSTSMHVCPSRLSHVKLYHYPRVCGSEVLCLLSRSGWARFLRPVGTDHRVCAPTDREQYTDNPLATSARTAQPLSPEADPFVQGETLGDGSKGRRNDLEWQSRELAELEADFKAQAQRSTRDRFSFLNQIPKQLLCRSRL